MARIVWSDYTTRQDRPPILEEPTLTPADVRSTQSAASQAGAVPSETRDAGAPHGVGQSHQRPRRNQRAPAGALLLAPAGPASLRRVAGSGADELTQMPRGGAGIPGGLQPSGPAPGSRRTE